MKNIVPRLYQIAIANSVLNKGNTLVVLPTGLGKTLIALIVAEKRKELGKILILAPTRPLVLQHKDFFEKYGEFRYVVALTGNIAKEKRKMLFKMADVIISTPQTIENDLLEGRISLEDVSLLVVDECHKTVGKYSYKTVVDFYIKQSRYPLILGMTASPSSVEEKIQEIINNLRVKNIEVRTPYDEDVRPYIYSVETQVEFVELSEELKKVRNLMYDLKKILLEKLKNLGFIDSAEPYTMTKKELLAVQDMLQNALQNMEDKSSEVFEGIAITAALLKLEFCIELLETQGVTPAYEHLNKIWISSRTGSQKSLRILTEPRLFLEILYELKKLKENNIEHPKIEKCIEILKNNLDKNRILIFCQYRQTANILKKRISEITTCERFVGQATREEDKGLTQKKQKEILDLFKEGKIKVLIATSVGEEGIDIPEVDIVLFYEAVPSEIRLIQRRGRTGRHSEGKLIVLVTKNTRDEIYWWASKQKEKRMIRILKELKEKAFEISTREIPEKIPVKIIADYREKSSDVVRYLIDHANVQLQQLEIGDYLISEDVVIERKEANDLIESMIDGRLFEQLKKLKVYKKPILIIEGQHSRKISENAYYGLISSIILDFGIPIIFTKSQEETAKIILNLARREQIDLKKEVRHIHVKKSIPLSELQLRVLESLPHIGPKMAKKILERFKTIKRFVNASELELFLTEGFGEKIIKDIKRVLETPYEEAKKIEFEDILK